MKPANCLPFVVLICLYCTITTTIFAQPVTAIQWDRDTVSAVTARNGQQQFLDELRGVNKKTTTYVSMSTAKLKDIMDHCAAAGIDSVQFMITMIRAQDTAHYIRNNPRLTTTQKRDLIGRQMLILRVPRAAFNEESFGWLHRGNKVLTGLLANGLILLNPVYWGLPADKDYYYFSAGTICPPPSSCG